MATCDAGHGCVITCPDGCYAIYWHPTSTCTKGCSGTPVAKLEREGRYSIAVNDFPADSFVETFGDLIPGVDAKSIRGPVSFRLEDVSLEEIESHLRQKFGG